MDSTPAPASDRPLIAVDSQEWLRALADRRHDFLAQELVNLLGVILKNTYPRITEDLQRQADNLAHLVLFILSHPTFIIPDRFADALVCMNHPISSLAAISRLGTTDAHLETVRQQPHNFVKILALWSARNTVQFDRAALFAANARLASLWYIRYAEMFHSGVCSELIRENLRRHFSFAPPALRPVAGLQEAYFGASYIDQPCERPLKQAVNQCVRRAAVGMVATHRPDPRKIAVASTYWTPEHSVYRICHGLIRALKPRYHLTLLQLGCHSEQDASLFDEVRIVEAPHGLPVVAPLLQNDFQVLLYPDIGMCDESIILSNLRLAPLQIALLGHSVSTFGAAIDYFISGQDVESPDRPEQHYSERLVLLPGMGAIHERPVWTPAASPLAAPSDAIIINCPCTGHKLNHPFLLTLAKVLRSASRRVLLRLFVGAAASYANDRIPFDSHLTRLLGPAVEIIHDLPYDPYMAAMTQGHFALDAFHFGGCNSVSDSLFLRIPILCRQGDRWYNRIGPHMLRLAGLPELIARDEAEYLALASRLIHDDPWRHALRQRLAAADLDRTIYSTADSPGLARAIDFLIAHHAQLTNNPDRTPIRMPRA